MKKIILLSMLTVLVSSFNAQAQDCDSVARIVETYITNDVKGKPFVSDGQVYVAFLDNEKAEFNTTLYGGSYYRLAASAGVKDDYVIFSIFDMEDNLLYTNRDHKNSPFWDFKIENTVPVRIQTELDTDKKVTGCAVLMIGFLK
jgi:hypothetical protein